MLTTEQIDNKKKELEVLKMNIENALKEKNIPLANELNKTRFELLKELSENKVKLEIVKKL